MPARRRTASHRWWTLAVVSLTQLLMVLDGTIVNVALPRAQAELGLSDVGRQWVVTAYALAFGSFLLIGGRVGDFWGRKRTYLLGVGVFGVASVWGGLTPSGAELVAARGVQGLAAAFMAPASLAFVTLAFPDGGERNRAFAIFGSLAGVGSAAGMLLGGLLTEQLSWRWCLLVNVPVVVVGLVAGVVLLPESRAAGDRRYDVAGAFTATTGCGLLVYGLTLPEGSWASPATVGCVFGGLGLLIGFVVVEHRAPHPLLPLRVVTHRTRAAGFAVQGLVGAVGQGVMVFLAFHLQFVMGLSPMQAGTGTLPFTVALMAAVPVALRMVDRLGPRRQMVLGPMISALGLVLLSRVTADGGYWMQVLPGLVLMGAGMGLTVVPLNSLALYGIAPQDAGVASATANATSQLGGSIGLAGLTAVYVVVTSRTGGGAESMVAGHGAVFVAGAGIFAAAAVVSWVLLRPGGTGGVAADLAPEVAVVS